MNICISFAQRFATLAAATAICCGAVGSASAANHQEEARSITVRFGDLNLANSEGVRTLYSRIRSAASRVCSDSEVGHLSSRTTINCERDAMDAAIDKINNGMLTAMHEQQKSSRRLG